MYVCMCGCKFWFFGFIKMCWFCLKMIESNWGNPIGLGGDWDWLNGMVMIVVGRWVFFGFLVIWLWIYPLMKEIIVICVCVCGIINFRFLGLLRCCSMFPNWKNPTEVIHIVGWRRLRLVKWDGFVCSRSLNFHWFIGLGLWFLNRLEILWCIYFYIVWFIYAGSDFFFLSHFLWA